MTEAASDHASTKRPNSPLYGLYSFSHSLLHHRLKFSVIVRLYEQYAVLLFTGFEVPVKSVYCNHTETEKKQ